MILIFFKESKYQIFYSCDCPGLFLVSMNLSLYPSINLNLIFREMFSTEYSGKNIITILRIPTIIARQDRHTTFILAENTDSM